MKYTRKEIDRTGKLLASTNPNEVKQAIDKLNDWRSLHLLPLDVLQNKIEEFLTLLSNKIGQFDLLNS